MLPASNRGAGQSFGMPDVCNTPTPAGPVPIPYPNFGMNAQATGFSTVVKVSGMNALNQSSSISMTSGDEAGSAHPTIKGSARYTMGNPIVFIDKMPAITLTSPTTGNQMNNAVGMVAVPSAVNVMFCEADHPGRPERVEVVDGAIVMTLGPIDAGVLGRVARALDGHPDGMPLVLDLRGHPGGAAEAALRLVDRFLPQGTTMALVDDGDGDREPLRARSRRCDERPLTILVDGGTASAAEIIAGCLAFAGRARLRGGPTHGKYVGRCGHRRAAFLLPDGRPVSAGARQAQALCPKAVSGRYHTAMNKRGLAVWGMMVGLPWACGGASVEEICEKVASCDQDQTVEECIEEGNEVETAAEEAGCGGEFDDFIDCANDSFECVDGEISLSCDAELFTLATCVDGEGSDTTCGWGCDGDGNCTCSEGPVDAACCEEGVAGCEASLSCENDCCA